MFVFRDARYHVAGHSPKRVSEAPIEAAVVIQGVPQNHR